MTPVEVLHRVFEKARKTISRHRHQGWDQYKTCFGNLEFRPLGALTEAVDDLSPEQQIDIIAQADSIIADGVKLLGGVWPAAAFRDDSVDRLWSYDPVSGRLWTDWNSYTFDINYRHRTSLGDVKYVWEINRLQFLQPIAVAFYLTSDQRYLQFIDRIIISWFKENPPFRGLGWSSGIEVALRSISLLMVLSMTSGSLSDETSNRIQLAMRANEFWIKRFPSLYSSANNHRIAELVALFLLSVSRRNMHSAGHHKIVEELESCFLDQIYSDGSPAEQSPSYGAFTVEFLLIALVIKRHIGGDFSSAVLARCLFFSDFIASITNSGGRVPRIGDDDEGMVLFSLNTECDYALEIADAVSRIIRREQLFDDSSSRGARNLLVGSGHKLPTYRVARKTVDSFHDGGISVLRAEHQTLGPAELVFDHGPLGFLSIAAHGHADALSFVYSVGGEEILTDPGTYLYHAGNELRDWFRGTQAHNTLTIDSCNQSIISGPFNWASKASGSLVFISEVKDGVSIEGEHDGYERYFGVTHRRRLTLTSAGFFIEDILIGAHVKQVELNFQFAMGWRLIESSGSSLLVSNGKMGLRVEGPIGSVVSTFDGVEESQACGMISTKFGDLSPALRLKFTVISPQQTLFTRATLVAEEKFY